MVGLTAVVISFMGFKEYEKGSPETDVEDLDYEEVE